MKNAVVMALAAIGCGFIGGYRTRDWRSGAYWSKSYPHSSTRQRARYARQLAAGQLNIASHVAPVSAVEPPPKKKRASRAKVKADA